jgi:uncharacterized protein (TIGR04255 family)
MTYSNSPLYRRPPIIEVIYGVRFEPFQNWTIPHTGAFWQTISNQFPRCEHALPIGDTIISDSATGLPLPRVWLINETGDRLLQLQSGRFLFNWRKQDSDTNYPSFERLSQEFSKLLQSFASYCRKANFGSLQHLDYELTYINHVLETINWSFPRDTTKAIPQVKWHPKEDSFLPAPESLAWNARFTMPEEAGQLVVRLNPAKRQADQKDILVLELAAKGKAAASSKESVVKWLSLAHEWILKGFNDLTSDQAKDEIWGRYERK